MLKTDQKFLLESKTHVPKGQDHQRSGKLFSLTGFPRFPLEYS